LVVKSVSEGVVRSFQALIDVLKGYGFFSIEADIGKRETDVSESLMLRNILTGEEIALIREEIGRYMPPRPRGRAHAVFLHGVQSSIHLFSVDSLYDSNSLGILSSTLREVGIREEEIFSKLKVARDLAIRYGR
jgi:hypothetical protein